MIVCAVPECGCKDPKLLQDFHGKWICDEHMRNAMWLEAWLEADLVEAG